MAQCIPAHCLQLNCMCYMIAHASFSYNKALAKQLSGRKMPVYLSTVVFFPPSVHEWDSIDYGNFFLLSKVPALELPFSLPTIVVP